ncbi:MAG: hypothetical protein GX601_06025, partial [Anaerolineales bacterium]|nr:hypothetical protein [Anaerolineales bacterium]
LNGPSGVPREWMALFQQESLDRIRANARRFTELVFGKKLGTLRQRQHVAG